MTGIWVVSYGLLWVLVVITCALSFGMLRQIGLLHRQLTGEPRQTNLNEVPHATAETQGPEIGSRLPALHRESLNGFGLVSLPASSSDEPTLLAFLSPLCDGCQAAVDPLNRLASAPSRHLRCAAVITGDHRASSAFMNLFPLSMPLVGDPDGELAKAYGIDAWPFALLYDHNGFLVRKALLGGRAYALSALLGEEDIETGDDLFPTTVSGAVSGAHSVAS